MRRLAPLTALALLTALGCEADPVDHASEAGVDGSVDASPDSEVPEGCGDPSWSPGMCTEGVGRAIEPEGAQHVSEPEEITWEADPPASGPHRPQWARWGEYSALGPDRWLHNLEHGGITFLYHPCAPEEIVDGLREIARGVPDDDTGPFRWILAPYPELPTAVMVLAWEWRYEAECVNADEILDFIGRRYRQASEDVASDGRFEEGWIGR